MSPGVAPFVFIIQNPVQLVAEPVVQGQGKNAADTVQKNCRIEIDSPGNYRNLFQDRSDILGISTLGPQAGFHNRSLHYSTHSLLSESQ